MENRTLDINVDGIRGAPIDHRSDRFYWEPKLRLL